MTTVEWPGSPTGNISEVTSTKNSCQEGFITNEEKPSISENTTSKFGLNTKTISLDVVPAGKALVLQGVYAVRSPPLEVVKEESVASVSHLDTLSVADTSEGDLIPDPYPVRSVSEWLGGVQNPVIVSATNEILISGSQDVDSNRNNSLLFSSAAQVTSDITNSGSCNSTEKPKPHALHSDVKAVSSPIVMTEQRPQLDDKECPFIDYEYEKTNCEQSFVSTSMTQEEAVAEYCVVLPNKVEKVGSCDLLVTENKCHESGNLHLPTQNRFTVCQSSGTNAVHAVPSFSSLLFPTVVSASVIKKSGQKVPEIQNKQHEDGSVTYVQRGTENCVSQTASCPNKMSTAVASRLKSKSVLKDGSAPLLANSHNPDTCSKATESSFPYMEAELVHKVSLPELCAPYQIQVSMPSHSYTMSASGGVTPVNTNCHVGASSSVTSGAGPSQNKQTLCGILSEDLTSSPKMFPEQQAFIVTSNYPGTRSVSSTDLLRMSGPECKDTKNRVPTKTVVIGTRQRKLATACPPNVSSLTETATKTFAASADRKKVQCCKSSCKSGGSDLSQGESVKIKSEVKK
jgi:hypothetical protein